MVSQNVHQILLQAQSLSAAERRQLLSLLNELPEESTSVNKEDELEDLLLAKGVIDRKRRKPTQADIDRFNAWKPVPIKGKPLSETIIEERR